MQKVKRFLIPIGFSLIFLIFILWYINLEKEKAQADTIQASGTVETVEISISPESAGKVVDVKVSEGDKVNSGDILVIFEGELLQTQYDQAKAALDQAKVNYLLISAQPLDEQRQVAIAAAQLELVTAQNDLQDLLDNAELSRASAIQSVEDAQDAIESLNEDFALKKAAAHRGIVAAEVKVKEAKHNLYYFTTPVSQAELDTFTAIEVTEAALEHARDAYAPYKYEEIDYDKIDCLNATVSTRFPEICGKQTTRDELREDVENAEGDYSTAIRRLELEDNLKNAEAELNKAVQYYESLGDSPSEADKSLLEAKLNNAIREYEAYKEGPDPSDIAMAEARVVSAESNLALALVNTRQEQLDAAMSQVDTAEASLEILRKQLDKLVLKAPADGIVLYRIVEPGEVVSPGSPVITLGLLDELTITVYIPEDQYGRINLGMHAIVSVDSFPGKVFNGLVTRIADQAEFTPRNVQTEEGRRTTVFAIELSVSDPDGDLKPGMPADVLIDD
jgi:multidrug resistance efflux pump